jgi:hypothetical protein
VIPSRIETAENVGLSPAGASGLSVFRIDSSDWAMSVGGGLRVALSSRWGADLEIEDVVRMNANLTDIDATSTPPPDQTVGRVYSTTFAGKDGTIHNFGIRLSVNYAVWPFGTPR